MDAVEKLRRIIRSETNAHWRMRTVQADCLVACTRLSSGHYIAVHRRHPKTQASWVLHWFYMTTPARRLTYSVLGDHNTLEEAMATYMSRVSKAKGPRAC